MQRIDLPLTDWSLLLAPRWGHLDAPAQVALLALLGAAPVALVLWLYRCELRLVRRRTAALLLGLRLLVLGLLWFVVSLQPVLARSVVEEIPGRVLIAVDRSASTEVADPQRGKLDKLRLARALHLRLDGRTPTDAQLDAWIRHYRQKGETSEPPWVAADEARDDADARRRLTEERRAQHDKLCAAVDRLTRSEVARRLLADDGAALLKAVGAKHKVELVAFDREVWEIEPGQVDELGGGKAGAKEKARQISRQFTDLRTPLAHALERSGPTAERTVGVVLLTDGQHNGGVSPVTKAAELGKAGVPVFPVALGARKAPPDVALLNVKAPANVFKDVDASVEARFKVSGLPAQEIVVELHQGKGEPPEEHVKRVQHDGTGRVYTVPFRVRMEEPGTRALEVKIRPTLKEPREINDENNHRAAVVRVAADRAKVLLIDGEARWEFHYLHSALRRDRSMEPDAVVFVQPRVGRIPEAQLTKIGNPRLTLPKPNEKEPGGPLDKYDCIVLGDVAPEHLPIEDRRRLEKYVADRGGTLVLLAGKRFMPLAFAEGGAEDDPLLKMLPVEKPRAVSPLDGFPMTLTHEGRQTSFLQLDVTPEESARRWAGLPRHYWGLVGRLKPGAIGLAYLAKDLRSKEEAGDEAGKKDGVEKAQALLARQNYGFGRVLFVGLDSTWRWRYRVGDTYHHRFWGQVMRWAASDRLLPAGNRYVRFGSRDPIYRQGQEAAVVVRLEDEAPPLAPGAPAAARIFRKTADDKEEPAALVELTRSERQPRLLEGAVRDLPPGQYRIELHIPALADKLKEPDEADEGKGDRKRDIFTVAAEDGDETVELATNWALLESLAQAGKGEVIAPAEVTRLVDLLTRQVETRTRREEQKVWQDPPLVWTTLGVFLVLLTLEWVGRKLAGLP
ncbi:MAG: VWA domain-containing protein [Gemmataceae bacterium]|nr:VWA domain-containing protein [Gemmataceae bacterium]